MHEKSLGNKRKKRKNVGLSEGIEEANMLESYPTKKGLGKRVLFG